jgi:hypothetical protein
MLLAWQDCIQLGIIPPSFPQPRNFGSINQTSNPIDCIKHNLFVEFDSTMQDQIAPKPIHTDKPMHIELVDGPIKPFRATATRQIPLRYQKEAGSALKNLIDSGIITPVNEPTDWCSHAFFVPKPNGKVRLVTDFTQLNKFVKRPVHPFPSTKDILQSIPADAKFFATLDAVHGYHQVALDEISSYMTTFLLPSGRYRYLRIPMGLSASSDEWCRISDQVIEGLPYAKKIVDDILVYAADLDTLHIRIRTILRRCKLINMTVSRSKFQIGNRVKFAGHIISADGISPDPDMLKAIKEFKRPANKTELRSFLGLANQLASFVPDLAHVTSHLCKLTSSKNAYTWLDDHERDFQLTKSLLSSDMVIKPFDPLATTFLLTDASRLNGLGFALMQKHPQGDTHRLVMCGSKALTDTQKRYATVELEALAIVYAIQKCSFYLKGLPSFYVITDHRPLIGCFNKPLHELENARLLRLREKIAEYSPSLIWAEGKNHLIADALSRAPVFEAEEVELTTDTAAHCLASTHTLEEIQQSDPDYKILMAAILNSDKDIPVIKNRNKYKKYWSRLSVSDDQKLIMLDNRRIVIPDSATSSVLKTLHQAHGGLEKTRILASQLYFWPNMYSDIKSMIQKCKPCQALRPALQKPTMVQTRSDTLKPMQEVASDLFSHEGQDYLIMVDRYSGFVTSDLLHKTTSSAIINKLSQWFNLLGWPQSIRTDGGPQFRTEFDSFCSSKKIHHELTSPHNPQANGLAESAVKNAKHLLIKCKQEKEDYQNALASFRNLPRQDGFSPAQLLFGRRQAINLPLAEVHQQALTPTQKKTAENARLQSAEKAKQHFNSSAKKHDQLNVGDTVLIKHHISGRWNREAKITQIRPDKMSYELLDTDNTKLVRGRRLLKPKPIPFVSDILTRSKAKLQATSTAPNLDSRQPTFPTPRVLKPPDLPTITSPSPTSPPFTTPASALPPRTLTNEKDANNNSFPKLHLSFSSDDEDPSPPPPDPKDKSRCQQS